MRVFSLRSPPLSNFWRGFIADWRFLTIIPVPKSAGPDELAGPAPLDVRSFPVVGWMLGGLAASVYLAADAAGLAPLLCALLAIGFHGAATGLLHEDGLADVADSAGGRTREHRLEILRDSRIGTYGVSALVLVAILRVAALSALGSRDPWLAAAVLMTAGAISRTAMGFLARILPNARSHGLSATLLPKPSRRDLAISAVLAIVPGLLLHGIPVMGLAVLLMGVMLTGLALLAHHGLGGRTGDVLGAGQLVAECGFLLAANFAVANMLSPR